MLKKLEERIAASKAKMPAEKRLIMEKATEELAHSEILKSALKNNDTLPEFKLKNAFGEERSLSKLLKNGPVILVFYRGSWCPYCNIQLNDYQERIDLIKKAGAQLVAISPEKADLTASYVKEKSLGFEVLSDVDNHYAKSLGLVFKLPADLKALYLSNGIDLDKSQGNKNWELPIAATYLVGVDRKILYSFLDVDYRKRAELSDILKALKK